MLFISLTLSHSFLVISNQNQLTTSIKPCEITPVTVSLWGHLAVFSSQPAGIVARQTLETVSCCFLKCGPTQSMCHLASLRAHKPKYVFTLSVNRGESLPWLHLVVTCNKCRDKMEKHCTALHLV